MALTANEKEGILRDRTFACHFEVDVDPDDVKFAHVAPATAHCRNCKEQCVRVDDPHLLKNEGQHVSG
jgi:hypothetical protein